MTTDYTYKNVYLQGDKYTSVLPFVGTELGMPKRPQDLTHTSKVFAENVNRLIDYYNETPAAAARRCKVSQQQMDRFTKSRQSPTLDSVHKVARGYDIEPYQLLVPDLEPRNLPAIINRRLLARIQSITAQARELDENSALSPDADRNSKSSGQGENRGSKKGHTKTKAT